MRQSSVPEAFADNPTLDELLAAARPVPPALRCPGCTVELEQHDDHGRCGECRRCWVPAAAPTPYLQLDIRQRLATAGPAAPVRGA